MHTISSSLTCLKSVSRDGTSWYSMVRTSLAIRTINRTSKEATKVWDAKEMREMYRDGPSIVNTHWIVTTKSLQPPHAWRRSCLIVYVRLFVHTCRNRSTPTSYHQVGINLEHMFSWEIGSSRQGDSRDKQPIVARDCLISLNESSNRGRYGKTRNKYSAIEPRPLAVIRRLSRKNACVVFPMNRVLTWCWLFKRRDEMKRWIRLMRVNKLTERVRVCL